MNGNSSNIEDLFRTQMESYNPDPSPGLWQKVHTRILWKQFLSFGVQTFNVYYLAAAISLAGIAGLVYFSLPQEQQQEETTTIRTESHSEYQPETTVEMNPESENVSGDKGKDIAPEEVEKTGSGKEFKDAALDSPNSTPPETKVSEDGSDMVDQHASESRKTAGSSNKSGKVSISAGFTPNLLEGCSPLAIDFQNHSENAVKYDWTFGDGGSSSEKDPSYVFDEPGEYPVILWITGVDGKEYITQETIVVYESPKALFEMENQVDLSINQPVYFYNYSRGADYYEWDFGDNESSDLPEPMHFYTNPGVYDVKLKAWTVNQCYDSLTIHNAFTGPEVDIRFPNAFVPNMSGPTGGYYDINDISNTVFHPVVSGELIEYQLKIFNRVGLLIFESNDVSIGWDGYYQEKLAGQAVYIWKVRGKFSNGKTFVKSGDVTLIKQY